VAAIKAILRLAILAGARRGAGNGVAASARRLATAALCVVVAGLLALAAVGCAAAALWVWAIPQFGPAGAPLAVAVALAAGCLAALALTRRAARPRQPPAAPPPPIELPLAEMARLFNTHKTPFLIAALIAGLLAGRDDG